MTATPHNELYRETLSPENGWECVCLADGRRGIWFRRAVDGREGDDADAVIPPGEISDRVEECLRCGAWAMVAEDQK